MTNMQHSILGRQKCRNYFYGPYPHLTVGVIGERTRGLNWTLAHCTCFTCLSCFMIYSCFLNSNWSKLDFWDIWCMTSSSRDLLDFMVTAWFVLVRIIPAGPEGPKRCIPGGLGQRECHGTRRSGHLWPMAGGCGCEAVCWFFKGLAVLEVTWGDVNLEEPYNSIIYACLHVLYSYMYSIYVCYLLYLSLVWVWPEPLKPHEIRLDV